MNEGDVIGSLMRPLSKGTTELLTNGTLSVQESSPIGLNNGLWLMFLVDAMLEFCIAIVSIDVSNLTDAGCGLLFGVTLMKMKKY